MNNQFNTKAAINLALLLLLFLFTTIPAQQVEEVSGLIEVKFKKGTVTRFDKGLSLGSIKNSDLKNYLSNIGFKDCRKIFSNVIEDDTIGINSEGKALFIDYLQEALFRKKEWY